MAISKAVAATLAGVPDGAVGGYGQTGQLHWIFHAHTYTHTHSYMHF